MRLASIVTTVLSVVVTLAAAPACAATCQELWVERNQIYKNHGYCFKTQRAIAYFGNAGCTVRNENALRLGAGDQNRIAQILRQERAQRCPK